MDRISLSPTERNFRSRLAQLAHDYWLLRGTLSVNSDVLRELRFHRGGYAQCLVYSAKVVKHEVERQC